MIRRGLGTCLMLLCVMVVLAACSQKKGNANGVEKTPVSSQERKQPISEELGIICKYLNVSESAIVASENLTEPSQYEEDSEQIASYEIQVPGEEKKSGYYCIELSSDAEGEDTALIAKALTEKELKSLNAKEYSTEKLCKILYTGRICDMGISLEERGYFRPSMESNVGKDYEENLSKSKHFIENGYINSADQFEISEIGVTQGTFRFGNLRGKQWVWDKGNWKKKTFKIPKELNKNGFTDKLKFEYNQLWYRNGKYFQVYDAKGKKLGSVDLEQWIQDQEITIQVNMSNMVDYMLDIQYMPDAKAIFNIVNEKKSYLVDMKTGNVLQKYDIHICGEVKGDYVVPRNCFSNEFELINWKKGKVECRLDVGCIRDEWEISPEYIGYEPDNEGEHGFYDCSLAGNSSIRCTMVGDKVYFSYPSGIYEYDKAKQILVKIFDGKKLSELQKMEITDFDANQKGEFYYMGYAENGKESVCHIRKAKKI